MRVHTLAATAIALASFAVAGCASEIDDPMTEQEVQQPSGTTSVARPFSDLDQAARWSETARSHAKPFENGALEAAQVQGNDSVAKPFAGDLAKPALDSK